VGKYLFLFTVGPVQSYIEQAVKLHDLYAGSRILSSLIKTALEIISSVSDNKIIFPYYEKDKQEKIISFPNRCVAIIECNDISAFADVLDKEVKDNYKDYILQKLREEKADIAKRQMEEHLKTFWVAIPYNKDSSYTEQYKKLESSMGAIKNIRYFEQSLNFSNNSKKCSICGERIALFKKDKCTQDNDKYLKENGKLCAVCYQKRSYEKAETASFPSTASISMCHWEHKLRKDAPELFKEYKELFSGKLPEQCWYIAGIDKSNLEGQGFKNIDIEAVREKLKSIDKYMKKHHPELIKYRYYSIIAFDGDNMGKWISGTHFKKNIDTEEAQMALSKALGSFAEWAKSEVSIESFVDSAKVGSVVYAGGEDFLGVVPLNNMFLTIDLLRRKFKELVSDALREYVKDDKELTFSMGICIAHYKSPLHHVLKLVRSIEKEAKEHRDEKNMFAIALMKRSGEMLKTKLPWYYSNLSVPMILKSISDKFSKNSAANSFIYKLGSEFMFNNRDNIDIPASILKSEINRLLKRAKQENELTEGEIRSLYEDVSKLVDITKSVDEQESFNILINTLLICEFTRREQDED
jgi:CRISPR-associated protein Cmr2